MNNKAVVILILALAFSILANINQFKTSEITSDQIDDLKFQRDSIIANSIIESKSREQAIQNKIDSIRGYNLSLIRKDSINHYKNVRERAKIPHYTPVIRNHVYDSIFGAGRL